RGVVETTAITIPEGLNVWQIAPILSEVTQNTEDEITIALKDPMLPERFNLQGPTIEGYLFPDTYRFANGISLETVITTMIEQYRSLWTDARKKALEASGMSEHEIVTLASIIQTEARQLSEMSRISGVYHNRIRDRWLLQADPTVIYALGGYRERLLYAAIDSVADNPYNTYTQPGLPPGPIASPGAMAIDAALTPEEHDYWYFVARPDGSHVFTSTLADHNRAKEEQRIARNGL
ncbi:MAG TPA: endolytic transglycosylase MltG, partial [Gemmatimonadetes bacterium]|nr:endolytic transglycosylase MltG [Gemmatimonadota bacterium]